MFSAGRVVGLGFLVIALVGCGGVPAANNRLLVRPTSTPKPPPTAIPAGELIHISSTAYANWGVRDSRGATTREMDAGDSYFKGTFIRGQPGQLLTLRIQNVAQQGHNFSLPAQGIDQHLPPGSDRVDVEVTFPPSGGLQFFCKYHTAEGMNGMLLVGGTTPQSVVGFQPRL